MTNDRYYGGLPHSSKTRRLPTAKDLADGLEQTARAMGKGVKSDVTANLAWAIRKGDKRHVQKLLDKHMDDIIGGQGTVNEIMRWLNGQIPEDMEATMQSLIQRLMEGSAGNPGHEIAPTDALQDAYRKLGSAIKEMEQIRKENKGVRPTMHWERDFRTKEDRKAYFASPEGQAARRWSAAIAAVAEASAAWAEAWDRWTA